MTTVAMGLPMPRGAQRIHCIGPRPGLELQAPPAPVDPPHAPGAYNIIPSVAYFDRDWKWLGTMPREHGRPDYAVHEFRTLSVERVR